MSLPSYVPAKCVHPVSISARADSVAGVLITKPNFDLDWATPKAPVWDTNRKLLMSRSFGFTHRLTVIGLAGHSFASKENEPPLPLKDMARSAYPCLSFTLV